MRAIRLAVAALLLLSIVNAQTTNTNIFNVQPIKKGLTLQATVWPTYASNWAGRFSCNNCNPFTGDQLCSKALPILCISNPKSTVRPFYNIAVQYTPYTVLDGGYYDGWTGGLLQTTLPVTGSDITSYQVGDQICKGYFGSNSNFATFDAGYYMPFMNQPPQKSWAQWNWGQTKSGGWNFWGYFDTHYRGRAWVWIKNQPNANCGN
jgi:hypothetical protein